MYRTPARRPSPVKPGTGATSDDHPHRRYFRDHNRSETVEGDVITSRSPAFFCPVSLHQPLNLRDIVCDIADPGWCFGITVALVETHVM